MSNVAIVVQRCHESIVGGSEAEAWQCANMLKNRYQVEILTTSAADYITWANEFPQGREERNGIAIRRFKVDNKRSLYWYKLHEKLLNSFNKANLQKAKSTGKYNLIGWTLALEDEFIRHQGPYSKDLLNFLEASCDNYKAIIFFSYLYPTTYFGIFRTRKELCLLYPTLHDEPTAYLLAYKYMAKRARKILWNSEAEQRLGTSLWGKMPGRVIGMSISTREFGHAHLGFPYVMYSGRIDINKGCEDLIKYFLKYKKENPSELKLVFTGKDILILPTHPDILFKGFVSEEEKFRLMAGASMFIMPSPYESFSVVTLEAMAQRTPVLVNGACEVLVDHVMQSGGGMIYRDYESFSAALNELMSNQSWLSEMSSRAREYVVSRYGYHSIRKNLIEEIEACE
ncbi:MAG: glycosyltransferase family 4 protein [Deltaproteobacteria bacterium]|nr:glycosyltransferase family 4 protein [Deltaproteobacteria bacterium]